MKGSVLTFASITGMGTATQARTGQEHNLANADQRACDGAGDGFAVLFAKHVDEGASVVAREVVVHIRLAAKLVHLERQTKKSA